MAENKTNTAKKYKATSKFDVDAHDNFEGLGADNAAALRNGKSVELENPPKKLIDNKSIEEVGGKK